MIDPQEIIALILKQLGGEVIIERKTFVGLDRNFEIMFNRDMGENLKIFLVDDEKSVANIRAERAAEQERIKKMGRLIVP